MKRDIEWFEDKLDKLKIYSNPDAPKDRNDLYTQYVEGVNDTVRQVKMLVGELDEPEVLSQEFPSVPQFVAEWYESEGKRSSWWNWFYKWGRDEGRTELEKKTIRWMQDFNEEVFVNMFLRGFTVEKEQEYTVSSPKKVSGFWFLSKNKDGEVVVGTNGEYFDYGWDALKLTEQEIKDYDERYWPFAVKVEELEE